MQKTETTNTEPVEESEEILADAETIEEVDSTEPDDASPPQGEEAATPAPERTEEDEALEARLLRLQADFDNYRKRTLRERSEWQRQAAENLLADLLPVIDHYELGLNTACQQSADPSILEGFQMVYEQFMAALKKHQVTPIPVEGGEFDHNLHEAITYVPSEEHPAGAIMAETRRGYRIGEKLLRASQVVVSSGPAGAEEETAE